MVNNELTRMLPYSMAIGQHAQGKGLALGKALVCLSEAFPVRSHATAKVLELAPMAHGIDGSR
jgi:hypothetical protein